MKNVKEK